MMEKEFLMTRISKQNRKRNRSPRKIKPPVFKKTGTKPQGYKPLINAAENAEIFIPKIKEISHV